MIYEDANISDFIRLCRELLDAGKTSADLRAWMEHKDNRIPQYLTPAQIKALDTIYQYRLKQQAQIEAEEKV